MPVNPGLMTSKTERWNTPPEIYTPWVVGYDIKLDVCASPGWGIVDKYIAPPGADLGLAPPPVAYDGLTTDWSTLINPKKESAWMNPPYGRSIGKWVEKAYIQARDFGVTTVSLLPSRTCTRWWHKFINPSIFIPGTVIFKKGRIHFLNDRGEDQGPAPFPSVFVVFHPEMVFNA